MKQVALLLIFSILLIKGIAQSPDSLRINPNPFNTSTTLYYYIANTDTATLKVVNNFGNTINIFFQDSILNAGAYSINYNATSLSNGVYYFSLKVGTNTVIRTGIKNTSAGISQITNSAEEIIFYPNPVSNIILLCFESISDYPNSTVTIQNTLGQTVKKISFTKNIDVSDLAEGYYFLQVVLSNGEMYTTKFIKQ